MRTGSLFTGFGGLDHAAHNVLGGELAWVSDNHPSATKLLAHRLPEVPNLGDITAIDWHQVEPVDLLTAGFPCQDISPAGKRAGIEGARSGLWTHVADAIRVLQPRHVVLENVAAVLVRGHSRVLADLAALGYDLRWTCLRASDVGAPHRRDRWFGYATPAHTDHTGRQRHRTPRHRSAGPAHHGLPAAHAEGLGRHQGRPEPTRLVGRPDPALRVHAAAADTDCGGQSGQQERDGEPFRVGQSEHGLDPDGRVLDWGQFGPAIRRWEHLLGRPAPDPTQRGRNNNRVLSPRFVEWLMGLEPGWVTGVPGLSRTEQLRLLGNGVVPQQGIAALCHLRQIDLIDHSERAA